MKDNNVKIAFVLDGHIEEIFSCDTRLAAILLSNPIILDITEISENINERGIFYNQDNKSFYKKIETGDSQYLNKSPLYFPMLTEAQKLDLDLQKRIVREDVVNEEDLPCCPDQPE
jgi:hypothetical protein